jgi:hypothetical protein
MSSYAFESNFSILILRLWREERASRDAPVIWRGAIEIVGSGEQYYVKNMDEIMMLIEQQLASIGIEQKD